MKKIVFACMVLFAVAAITAPAQALPICLKWTQFCDGVQVNNQGLGGGSWYHFDCANNSPMDVSPAGNRVTNCSGTGGSRILRSSVPNGPGDYYFIVETPLDGSTDMHQGIYPNGACWIDDLAYAVQMGSCTGLDTGGKSGRTSSIQ
jgi:hypothetical protein